MIKAEHAQTERGNGDDIRRKFLDRNIYTRPSMEKCINLLTSNNKNILVKFSKFICFAMLGRNENAN